MALAASSIMKLIGVAGSLGILVACGGLSAFNPDGLGDDTGDTNDTDTGLDTDTDTDTETGETGDTGILPLSITDIEPAYGSNNGGTTVTLTGGPFDDSLVVWFGTQQGRFVSSDGTTAVVRTPAVAVDSTKTGPVEVRAETDTHRGSAADAFYFWPDGSGRFGALGSISWVEHLGSYWTGDTAPYGTAAFYWTTPVTASGYWQFAFTDTMQTCKTNYVWAGQEYTAFLHGASTATLVGPTGARVDLVPDIDDAYFMVTNGDLGTSQYTGDGDYTLEFPATAEWPEMDVDAIAHTSPVLNITEPAMNGTTPPTVRRASFDLRWSGTKSDYVLVLLSQMRWNSFSSEYDLKQEVSCAVNDTGFFRVPSSAWTEWRPDDVVIVQLARATEVPTILPHNNSSSGVVGLHWNIGAVVTAP